MENLEEIWVPAKYYFDDGRVIDYSGLYIISNYGRIKTLGNGKSNFSRVEKELSYLLCSDGYYRVQLYYCGNKHKLMLSRLVYSSFVGKIPKGMEVNHINEIKTDNRLSNLNLMSRIENINWGTKIKRTITKTTNGKCSKPVEQYDLNGNHIKDWPSITELKRQFGYATSLICKCCMQDPLHKTAYGYIWRYKKGDA